MVETQGNPTIGLDCFYKYLHFIELQKSWVGQKTKVWSCRSNRDDAELGKVRWYGPWRQYCYFPGADTVFNATCLAEIAKFLDEAMEERKALRRP